MAVPWGGIAVGAAEAIKALAAAAKQPVSPAFTSQEEYAKAKAEYDRLDRIRRGKFANDQERWELAVQGKQGIERQMLEIYPSIQEWEQTLTAEAFRGETLATQLGRVGEREVRGVKRLRGQLYAKGLRGEGEVLEPIEDLRREASEARADLLRGEAGTKLGTQLGLEAKKTQQQYGMWDVETELYGQAAGLATQVVSEFRPGGMFGKPTEAQQMGQRYADVLEQKAVETTKPKYGWRTTKRPFDVNVKKRG